MRAPSLGLRTDLVGYAAHPDAPVGIFILVAIYALYFARDFVMPVVLAFLLALMLTPIVRFLKKRGVPEALSATFWC